ncbi:DUF2335 domain-containing protein [Bifidobacterium simiarum]|nr:DUF2335 domain-containing protein [Bifidobacterium simiarum]
MGERRAELRALDELIRSGDEQAIDVILERRFSGPLPSPEVLAGYGDIDPSLPGRIVSMAERQLDANIRNESRLTLSESVSVAVASVAASVLPWCVCVVSILAGQNAAAVLGGAAGVAVAGVSVVRAIRGVREPKGGEKDSGSHGSSGQ